MENNNNGRGIFYGVIGVATLVVAIIGATFAYFSASVTINDAINVASTTLNLEMSHQDNNFKTDLIPVETDDTTKTEYFANGVPVFAGYPGISTRANGTGEAGDACVDNVGNSICSVYEFTVYNPSDTVTQTVVGSMTIAANTGFSNLKYAVFKGLASATGDSKISSYNVGATAVTTVNAAVGTLVHKDEIKVEDVGTTQNWPFTTEQLDPKGSTSYTVVVWLEDTGSNQDAEQGETFAASVSFTSDNGGGVTGVITAS